MEINLFTLLAILIFLGVNLICLLLGFKLGRTTTVAYKPQPKKEKEPKPELPWTEDITEDPWTEAMTEDTTKGERGQPKVVGGM